MDSSLPSSVWDSNDGSGAPSLSQEQAVPTPAPQTGNSEESPALLALARSIEAIAGLADAQTALANNQRNIQATLDSLIGALRPSGPGSSALPGWSPAPSGNAPPPRFKDPRVFDGSPASVDPFLSELENALYLQRRSINSDYEKSLYLSTWLKDGSPKSWFFALQKTSPGSLNDFDALIDNFKKHFGDTDFVNSQMRKLRKLKQTSSAAKYASQFREILAHLPMQEDHIRIVMFKEGLKSEVKALFVTISPPAKFDDFVTQAIEFDNRLHAHAEDLKDKGRLSLPFLPSTTSSTTSSSSAPVPMEIDAVRHRGPITDAERKRRRDNNLCSYCGGAHKDCPILAARDAKRSGNTNTQGKVTPEAPKTS